MATRQYIGARYVPRFFENTSGTSDWRPNTQYEPLTIVTRNGNSYTSKIPVPASVGAPENNPEYWVSTGIYNAQVQTLSDRIDSNEENITELENTKAMKRKYILIGDSYAVGAFAGDVVNGWTYYFKQHLGLTEGVDCFTAQQGQLGFNTSPNNFATLLQSINTDDPNSITDIVVAGGHNDTATVNVGNSEQYAALTNSIESFYNLAHRTYPNAKVWISYISKTIGQPNSWIQRARVTKFAYQCDYKSTRFNRIVNIDLALNSEPFFYQSKTAQTDAIHCNQEGYHFIGNALAAGTLGATVEPFRTFTNITYTLSNGLTNSNGATNTLACQINNGIASLITGDAGWTFDIGETKPVIDQWFEIADLPYPLWGASRSSCHALCSGYYRRASGTSLPRYGTFNGVLGLAQGKLSIRMIDLNQNGSSFADLTEIDQISLRFTELYFPVSTLF